MLYIIAAPDHSVVLCDSDDVTQAGARPSFHSKQSFQTWIFPNRRLSRRSMASSIDTGHLG